MSRPFFFGGNQSAQQSPYLVQFKAGKMIRNGNTVSPVKEKKGLVYLHQSSDDNLMHFCWKDRTSGDVEDDLIIFPDDAEFLKVPQCTTGRVFVLKFKTSPRRLFFWSQEPKDDKDDDYVSKINEYINNPSAASRNSGGNHVGLISNEMSSLNSDEELRNLFNSNNFSAQQLMSMLDGGLALLPHSAGRLATLLSSAGAGGTGGASTGSGNRPAPQAALTTTASSTPAAPQTPSTTPAQANSSNSSASESSSTTGGTNTPIRLVDLQNIISGLTQTGQRQKQQESSTDVHVDLSTSINYDVLKPLLSNEDFLKRVNEMIPKLPGDDQPAQPIADQVGATVRSPQFQQALSSFSTALQSGQLGPLVQQFGLHEDCVKAANAGDLEAFVKALQKSSAETTTPKKVPTEEKPKPPGAPEKKDKPNQDDMALD